MELHITEAQEATLSEIARNEGKSIGELLVEAASGRVKSEGRRWAEIEHAMEQVERSEFLEEDEMDRRVARMLAR